MTCIRQAETEEDQLQVRELFWEYLQYMPRKSSLLPPLQAIKQMHGSIQQRARRKRRGLSTCTVSEAIPLHRIIQNLSASFQASVTGLLRR